MFELAWSEGRARLGELDFRIQDFDEHDGEWGPRDSCFRLFKTPGLLAEYLRCWRARPDFGAERVVEVGLWDGGSTVLWFEYFQPRRLVGLDYATRGDSPYFRRYLAGNERAARIATYWGVDQTDRRRVHSIVTAEFDEPLDLIIDDASHQYADTKATFEVLFPLLREGGLYVIEDWAFRWQVRPTPAAYVGRPPLHRLVHELVALVGSGWFIGSLALYHGFALIERGPGVIDGPAGLAVDTLLPADG